MIETIDDGVSNNKTTFQSLSVTVPDVLSIGNFFVYGGEIVIMVLKKIKN